MKKARHILFALALVLIAASLFIATGCEKQKEQATAPAAEKAGQTAQAVKPQEQPAEQAEEEEGETTNQTVPAKNLKTLEITRAAVDSVNLKKLKAEVLLDFNTPPSLHSLRERMSVQVNDAPAANLDLRSGEKNNQALISMDLPSPSPDNRVTVKIKSGMESSNGQVITDRDYSFPLKLDKAATIKIWSHNLNEAANGFYIYVNCQDKAQEYNRCRLPVEELKNKVRFTPPVETSFIPDNYGFKVYGNFKKGSYVFVIDSGLSSAEGGVLDKAYTAKLDIPNRSASATFLNKGRYLPRQRLSTVPIRHINIDRVDVSVRKVPEQNMIFWLSGDNETTDDRLSDVIAQQTYELENKEDEERTDWIDLSGLLPADSRGLFEFTLSGGNKKDAMRLILSKLSVVAKRGGEKGNDLMLWVIDAEKLTPVDNALVELMSESNRIMLKSNTNPEGLVHFSRIADSLKKDPFAVIVKTQGDLIALKFTDIDIKLSEYQVQGLPYKLEKAYRAAIYTDRGVYRPGETAHLVSIVWEASDRASGETVPVNGHLQDPKGRVIEDMSTRTNSSGMASFDIKFQDFADTGKYEFALEIGGQEIQRYSFYVEEFVPERMKVDVASIQETALTTEQSEFHVKARYLFGAPAKGERMEAECIVDQGEFKLEKYPGYTFGVWRAQPFKPLPLGTVKAMLNNTGEATVTCPAVSAVTAFKGPGRVKASVSVFEAGSGRTTTQTASVPVHPAKFYIGLNSADKKASVGRQVKVNGIIVDQQGNPVTDIDTVKMQLLMIDSQYVYGYDEEEGGDSSHRYLRDVPLGTDTASVKDGKFTYTFMPRDYDYGYVVRASVKDQVQTDLFFKGDSYFWMFGEEGNGNAKTPPPALPEGLVVEAPEIVKVGEAATVSLNLPYPGRLLLTVETDQVVESRWLEVQAGSFSTELKLEKFAPNVYVSALLIKDPFFESREAFLPGRAFGVKSVKVRPEQHEINLKLSAPEKIEPNRELVVDLDTGGAKGPIFATVAVVDEGILQLTKFATPDPLQDMFKKRGLQVTTFETVGWTLLLPEKSTGGDQGQGPSGRIKPIKPVALWSGVVEVDQRGKASVKFNIPTYRGQLRVMAVAASKDRIGSASADVIVRDPLTLQPTFPRFLIANDRFVVPVFLTNLTGKQDDIQVEIKTNNLVNIIGESRKTIALASEDSGTVTFVGQVCNISDGVVEIEVIASDAKNNSRDSVRIPITPDGPVTQEFNVVKLIPGDNDLTSFLKGWKPQFEQTTVTVLANRYAREMGHLKYLIRYPFGCIEQTTSTTRPLLYVGNLVSAIDPGVNKDGTIEEKFMHGIRRLFSMQTGDGGFSYWPGEQANTYWGTAYATHVLLEGLDAGYPINRERVEQALTFMDNMVTNQPNLNDPKYGYSMAESVPYMLYVLARGGRPKADMTRGLIEKPRGDWGELGEENMFLLKAALYLSGDRTYENELRQAKTKISDVRLNNWSFYSGLRTRGMMLNILEDLFPNSPQSEELAQSIAELLKKKESRNYTTQELSWCVSGLGKRAATSAAAWSQPDLYLDAEIMEPVPKKAAKANETTWLVSGASRALEMLVAVDTIEGGDLYAMVLVEGVKPGSGYVSADNGIKVERNYRTQDGAQVDLGKVRLGDVVYVELTLQNLTKARVNNVALVDRFPAGMEIENPRLNKEHAASWIVANTLWEPDYVNMRDDRIEYFGHLDPHQTVKAVYVVRAVLGGRFKTPPVRADAMYEPNQFSQKPGKMITILDPWNAITD